MNMYSLMGGVGFLVYIWGIGRLFGMEDGMIEMGIGRQLEWHPIARKTI